MVLHSLLFLCILIGKQFFYASRIHVRRVRSQNTISVNSNTSFFPPISRFGHNFFHHVEIDQFTRFIIESYPLDLDNVLYTIILCRE